MEQILRIHPSALVAVLAALVCPILLDGQGGSAGTITGAVTDPTGARVPGAVVSCPECGHEQFTRDEDRGCRSLHVFEPPGRNI